MPALLARIWRRLRGPAQWYILWVFHSKFMAGITGLVPERVIDFLEMVQVNKQQRNRQAASPGARAGRIEPLDQRAPVEHSCESINFRVPLGL